MTAAVPSPADAGLHQPVPRLAEGTELLGPYKDSGCVQPPSIIRRADGRMLEVSPLLHQLAATLGHERQIGDLSARMTAELGRAISAHSVEYLIENKLRPLGVLADSSTAPPRPQSAHALLGLTLHVGVVPARVVQAITTVLRPLFLRPVVIVALVMLVAADVGLLLVHGLGQGLTDVLSRPALLLVIVALNVVAGGFHELGHATASRYSGAEPGVIGAGIYLVWPVFYNDLDDSHRLDRAGRLRCDLGGVYFNVIFILVLAGLYGLTGFKPLLVTIALQHLAILRQFLPFVRLDGYYVVSDLAGVPDLFGRIKPIMSSLVPGRSAGREVTELRPGARGIVTAWVLISVPLLAASVLLLAVRMPSLVTWTAESVALQAGAFATGVRTGEPLTAVLSGLEILALAVPVVGLTVILVRVLSLHPLTRLHHRLARLVLAFGAPRSCRVTADREQGQSG